MADHPLKQRWPFYWALAATLFLLLVQYFLQMAVVRVTNGLTLGHAAGLLLLCFPPLACAGLACIFIKRMTPLSWAECLAFAGLKRIRVRPVALGILLSLPVLGGYFLAARHYLGRGIPVSFFPEWPFLLVLFVLSAGLCEELVYRGFLFQCLRTQRSFFSAATLSSFLWALSHLGNAFMGARVRVLLPEIMVFFLGIAAAWVFEKTGNALWSWGMVHVAIDSIGLLNIGNTGLFRAPVGGSMAYLFGGEALCILLAFPLAHALRVRQGARST